MQREDWRIEGRYLGDPQSAAQPRELKIASIIADSPRFSLEDIEEQLFLRSLGGLHFYVSDEELN